MMATWEDLEKQVLAHNTEVCARIRQSIGQLPTIKCIDMDDDEGSDEEIFFSPPSSKYLGLELMDKKDAIIVDKSNCTISQEPLPRAVDVNKTASKPFNTNAPGTSLTEQNIYIIKESPQALKESEQVRETSDDAFQMCLAAGETTVNNTMEEFLADDMPTPDNTQKLRKTLRTKSIVLSYFRRIVAFFRDSKIRRFPFRFFSRNNLSFQPLEDSSVPYLTVEEEDLTLIEADTDPGSPELDDGESFAANNLLDADDWTEQKPRLKFWNRYKKSGRISDGLELVSLKRTHAC